MMPTSWKVELPPGEILRQVGNTFKHLPPTAAITVSRSSTQKAAVDLVYPLLDDVQTFLLGPLQKPKAWDRLKQLAREVTADDSGPSMRTNVQHGGLQIHTDVSLKELPTRSTLSQAGQARLKENARNMKDIRDPYPLRLTSTISEQALAVVPCSLFLQGFESEPSDPTLTISRQFGLWDTGAHVSCIVEDMLPESFREFLSMPKLDDWRLGNTTRVRVMGTIGFSNSSFTFETVFLVLPRTSVPNERIGIVFGQKAFMDHMVYTTLPRAMLRASGEDIPDDCWGHIDVLQFMDLDEKVIHF